MSYGLIAFRCATGVSMHKTKTHFEQVPLETVRRIIEQIQRESANGDGIKDETLEGGFAEVKEPSAAELANFLTGSYRSKQ
jgi:hypothetical protein